jgi:Tfp pilus assembly protein PilF
VNPTLRIALLASLAVWASCAPKPAADDEATLMKGGLDALYTRHDAAAAAVEFRKVLERNPTHYGATFQLASALDAAGRPDEARPLWEKMLVMAEAHGDKATAETARGYLGKYGGASEETLMQAGLDALYKRRDPNDAIAQFRQVLARNPAHYGATFQLASALDTAGKRAEARPVWEKMLQMAETAQDAEVANTVRARLQSNP